MESSDDENRVSQRMEGADDEADESVREIKTP